MRQDVQTCPGRRVGWHGFNELRVNNCDIWRQSVVSQWVLDMRLGVGDNRKWRNFRTGTRSRRDPDKLCLLWPADLVGPLTDIKVLLPNPIPSRVWVLIEHPHCLSSVHWRTTTQSDDRVWLEVVHPGNTLVNRIR